MVGKPYSGDALLHRYLRAARRLAAWAVLLCIALVVVLPALGRNWPPLAELGLGPDDAMLIYGPLVLLCIVALVLNGLQDRMADRHGVSRD